MLNLGKGLVCFSLWGDDPLYTIGALRNVWIWENSPFNVDCRFYVHHTVPEQVIRDLEANGADVRLAKEANPSPTADQTATFWRYKGFDDHEGYDYILQRDVDSRPYEREFEAIEGWLASNKEFHVIRDHVFHGVPILAGLFGARRILFDMLAEHLPSHIPYDFYQTVNGACSHIDVDYPSNDFYQVDQWWLRQNVYPLLMNKIYANDDYFGFERKRFRVFLSERSKDYRFVGEGFTMFDTPRYPEHRELLRPRFGYTPKGVNG